jgi:hypothetical protein
MTLAVAGDAAAFPLHVPPQPVTDPIGYRWSFWTIDDDDFVDVVWGSATTAP